MRKVLFTLAAAFAGIAVQTPGASAPASTADRLARHRNLGKAFYENPTTQAQAVEEFRKALALAPGSVRDRVNYGLALLRVGRTKEGIAQLKQTQRQDPSIPHTWFNLGIAYKREELLPEAIAQFTRMVKLVPDEPVSHYNLGVLYKLTGKPERALEEFQTAARLNPELAGPHFQLYNMYRQAARAEEASRELELFNAIKKRQAGAAVPEDLEWSYYAEVYAPVASGKLGSASPAVVDFLAHHVAAGFDPASSGIAVLDAEGEGRADLLVWSRHRVQLFKSGLEPVSKTGLEDLDGIVSIAPGDFNNDGLADLAVVTESGASLYINRKGVFEKSPVNLPAGKFRKAVWFDYDHDYDLDLFLLGEKSVLMRNDGQAGFSDQTSRFPFAAGRALDGTIIDLLPDSHATDLLVTYADHEAVLYRDRLGGHYEMQPMPELPAGSEALSAIDVNNDGWTDLIAATADGISVLLNRAGKLEQPTRYQGKPPLALADWENRGALDMIAAGVMFRSQGSGKYAAQPARQVPGAATCAVADFDGDGREDLALITQDGSVEILFNRTKSTNSWLALRLEGVRNQKLAPGAVVEARAGSFYEKRQYRGTPLVLGLGPHTHIDALRVTWPNGLVQNETNLAANRLLLYREKPRLSGSCPMIFVWDGNQYRFITDVLGVAPLGASSGDGQYFPVNHREHILVPGEAVVPRNGAYQLRITEELHEVSYIDQVSLIAVDHPANTEVFTNDKFKAAPSAELRLFGVRRHVYARQAHDQSGEDSKALILRRDGIYAGGFQCNHAGVAGMHSLELDFGDAAPNNRSILVLNGWVDWPDASTFVAASQATKEGLVFPYLQVQDESGAWQTVMEDMGIPAGKPKTIVVDLTGTFLSRSRKVRIVTNLCLYWDEIYLSEETEAPALRMTELDAAAAELRFHGFSTPVIDRKRARPERFQYQPTIEADSWNPVPGLYTRYGDVRDLLAACDDRLVIMGSGDELRLEFDARRLPPLAPAWKRDFLLLVDGWAKDNDANTGYSESVEPLPFHGMSSYPYNWPEHFPDDVAHQAYRQIYNTRQALRLLEPLQPRIQPTH